jgi:hypothetical protein
MTVRKNPYDIFFSILYDKKAQDPGARFTRFLGGKEVYKEI